jgi:DNA-binding MarR family transcriptional regulator
MPLPRRCVNEVAAALIDLIGCMNNPRQDDVLLGEAGVTLDRALFPLVARLGALGAMGVAELGDHAGRDPTTISRQLAVLERDGLVRRRAGEADRRVREAELTEEGRRVARRLADARRRLLTMLLADWTAGDCDVFSRLALDLADGMKRGRAHRGS